MNKCVWILLVAVALIMSCKSKKLVGGEAEKARQVQAMSTANATLVKAIAVNENDFGYYNARGSVTYKSGEESFDLDLDMVMEKDQYLYINATWLLGVPVARVLITRDSIQILDITHKKHIVTSYAYIRKMTNVSLNLRQVQSIFSGNTLYSPDSLISVDSILSYILVNTRIAPQQQQTTYYNNTTLKVSRSLISEKQSGREFRVEYTESYNQGSNSYPKDFNINMRAEKSVECHFVLNYFAFEKKKETKFVVPKNYETVRM